LRGEVIDRGPDTAALSLRRQQCLYFLPLPQGQGSLRPGFMSRR
jgi:hypothetical protein